MGNRIKIRNFNNFKDDKKKKEIKQQEKLGIISGIDNNFIEEPIPEIEVGGCEILLPNKDGTLSKNNAVIIFGRDRPSVRSSGYGGRGATQCARIDLIAGVASSWSKNGPPDRGTIVNPNFALDASRIYMSQKADIDAYMGLAEATRSESKGCSAIGMKSDCIRIVGRKNIKIVTGKGRFQDIGKRGEKNAAGGSDQVPGTISFIAGNYTESEEKGLLNKLNPIPGLSKKRKKLQGLVKGDNMIEALEDILNLMDTLATQISALNSRQRQLAYSYAFHSHNATAPGAPVIPTTAVAGGLRIGSSTFPQVFENVMFDQKTELFKLNYLKPISPSYIASRHVYTT